jgi:hypothetical protein
MLLSFFHFSCTGYVNIWSTQAAEVHGYCALFPLPRPIEKSRNMILILSWQTLSSLALLLTCSFRGVLSNLQLMKISVLVAEITGYPGLSYEAARYEPLCGQLGTGSTDDAQWDFLWI